MLWVSSGLHLTAFVALLFWGSAEIPPPPEPVDLVMVELPKGPSETVGLGTQAAPPDETPPPQNPPAEKLSDLMERLATKPVENPEPPAKDPLTEPIKPLPPKEKPKPAEKVAQEKPKPKPAATPPQPKSAANTLAGLLNKQQNQLNQRRGNAPQGAESPGWKYGTGTQPLTTIPTGAIMSRYTAVVKQHVTSRFVRPPSAPGKRPRIHLSITGSGQVTGRSWVQKSGIPVLDEAAMRAATRSSPVPVPPVEIREKVVAQGITVTF